VVAKDTHERVQAYGLAKQAQDNIIEEMKSLISKKANLHYVFLFKKEF